MDYGKKMRNLFIGAMASTDPEKAAENWENFYACWLDNVKKRPADISIEDGEKMIRLFAYGGAQETQSEGVESSGADSIHNNPRLRRYMIRFRQCCEVFESKAEWATYLREAEEEYKIKHPPEEEYTGGSIFSQVPGASTSGPKTRISTRLGAPFKKPENE